MLEEKKNQRELKRQSEKTLWWCGEKTKIKTCWSEGKTFSNSRFYN